MEFNVTIDELIGKNNKLIKDDKGRHLYTVNILVKLHILSQQKGILALKEEIERKEIYVSEFIKIAVNLVIKGLSPNQISEILDNYVEAESYQGKDLLESRLIKEGILCIQSGSDINYMVELLCSLLGLEFRKQYFSTRNLGNLDNLDNFYKNIESKYCNIQYMTDETSLLEDCVYLDEKILQKAITNIDNSTLITALKGASGNVINCVLNKLSVELAYFISEDLSNNIAKISDIIDAQKKVIETINNIEKSILSE